MNPSPTHATVRHTLLRKKTIAEGLATLDVVCTTAAQCPEVQNSPSALHARSVLQQAVTTAHASLTTRVQLAQALMTAIKVLGIDFGAVKIAVRTFEACVAAVAKGDASVINKSGLLSRVQKTPPLALGKVSVVHAKVGKHHAEGIISWPPGPGATNGYAIEVNYTPQNPAGTWVALTSGTSRRRVVKAPTPGAQLLARVASLGSGGTQSEWSDAILVTTL